jgi:hypothetical protein
VCCWTDAAQLRLCGRYTTLGLATVILGVGLSNKPDTSATNWARREAQKQLDGQ